MVKGLPSSPLCSMAGRIPFLKIISPFTPPVRSLPPSAPLRVTLHGPAWLERSWLRGQERHGRGQAAVGWRARRRQRLMASLKSTELAQSLPSPSPEPHVSLGTCVQSLQNCSTVLNSPTGMSRSPHFSSGPLSALSLSSQSTQGVVSTCSPSVLAAAAAAPVEEEEATVAAAIRLRVLFGAGAERLARAAEPPVKIWNRSGTPHSDGNGESG